MQLKLHRFRYFQSAPEGRGKKKAGPSNPTLLLTRFLDAGIVPSSAAALTIDSFDGAESKHL
jgi:hypothetical protein